MLCLSIDVGIKNLGYIIYDASDNTIKDWNIIEVRILAELANQVSGRNEYYKTLISKDPVIIEAIKHFEEAKALLN